MGSGLIVVAVLVALAMSVKCTVATFYIVGEGTCTDSFTWSSQCDYSSWALSHDFVVGDTLDFEFDESSSTVAQVSETGYSECSPSTTITDPPTLQTTSPFTFDLTEATNYYFVSIAADGSCNQKLSITVTDASSTTPLAPSPAVISSDDWPSPPPPPPPRHYYSPPPPPASSSSSSSKTLKVTLAVGGSVGGLMLFTAKIFLIVWCHRRRKQKKQQQQQETKNNSTVYVVKVDAVETCADM